MLLQFTSVSDSTLASSYPETNGTNSDQSGSRMVLTKIDRWDGDDLVLPTAILHRFIQIARPFH